MKALLRPSRQPGVLRLVDLPIPEPSAGEVLAKVAYAGICGSDLAILHDCNSIYCPPVVQGHEFSATIVSVGPEITEFSPGDSIVSETTFRSCGGCQSCRNGAYHLCLSKDILGWTQNGGFAQYVLLNSPYLHKLSPNTDLRAAALIEPTAIAAESVSVKGKLQAGESVVVIGAGTIGLLCALVAKELGARIVYLIGLSDSRALRFPIAAQLGITHCIDASQTDALLYIQDTNSGDKPDLVIDATGQVDGFFTALHLIRRNGRIVETGSITTADSFPWKQAAFAAVDMHFVFSSSHQAWTIAVNIFNTTLTDYTKLITATYALDEFGQAFEQAADPTKSLKILFDPSK